MAGHGTVRAEEVVVMAKSLSVQAAEVPLYLIPKVIAALIQLKGEAVYRISVVRTHWHHYNVSIRTKLLGRLAPGPEKRAKKASRRCGT
jgi:hypothetical protein